MASFFTLQGSRGRDGRIKYRLVDIESYADYTVTDLLVDDHVLDQDACYLFISDQQVIGPFDFYSITLVVNNFMQ